MNTYKDKHSNKSYTQKQIDTYVVIASKVLFQEQKDEHGYNFCIECKRLNEENGFIPPEEMEYKILDPSHKKSRAECKNDSTIEEIFNVDNLQVLCRFHHKKTDSLNLQFKGL